MCQEVASFGVCGRRFELLSANGLCSLSLPVTVTSELLLLNICSYREGPAAAMRYPVSLPPADDAMMPLRLNTCNTCV